MRRFSLVLFTVLALVGVFSGRNDSEQRRTEVPASANTVGVELAGMSAAPDRQALSEQAGQSGAPDQPESAEALVEIVAILATRARALEPEAQPASAASAPVIIAVAAKTDVIDPALESLTGADLTSAAQGELKRLGCYKAKIDGKWGRKSEAALKAFGARASGAWTDVPRRELVTALRTYPANFCTAECAPNVAGGQCGVAAQPIGEQPAEDARDAKPIEAAKDARDTSYLPPWMQPVKLTSAGQPETALGAQTSLSDAAPVTSKPKKRKSERRRVERERIAQDYERSRSRDMDWLPSNWPGR
jgi:hypothetical protein